MNEVIKVYNVLKKGLVYCCPPYSAGFNRDFTASFDHPPGGPWDVDKSHWVTSNENTDRLLELLNHYYPKQDVIYREVEELNV